MASYLIQAGSALYLCSVNTGVDTAVSLPAGITISSTGSCRALVFGSGNNPYVLVFGNAITKDIYIDQSGVARLLQVQPPTSKPTLSAGTGSGLNGVYQAAVSFKVKDGNGNLILESAIGPAGSGASVTGASIALAGLPVSADANINARGIYRSVSGGSLLYPWFDIDDNTTLTDDRGVVDASLSLLSTASVNIGTPPDLSNAVTWKNRIWGVSRVTIDNVRWTEESQFYAWNPTNEIVIPPQKTDAFGVTAFIPRRDQLGIARVDRFYQVVGDSNDNFQRQQVSETIGCVSQESVVVVRDTAYFLGDRGVAEWTAQTIGYVSEATVDGWFASDTYFNRALFSKAQGRYNRETDSYELLLASAGSSVLDTWVSFDLKRRCWFGPHKTTAFQPTVTGNSSDMKGEMHPADANAPVQHLCVFGASNGNLYTRDASQVNDLTQPVVMAIELPTQGGRGDDADVEKVWLEPSVIAQTTTIAGEVLTVQSTVMDTSGQDSTVTQTHDLTATRGRLFRPGVGRLVKFILSHSGKSKPKIFSFHIPYNILGRR